MLWSRRGASLQVQQFTRGVGAVILEVHLGLEVDGATHVMILLILCLGLTAFHCFSCAHCHNERHDNRSLEPVLSE